jgi:hypothetical protein
MGEEEGGEAMRRMDRIVVGSHCGPDCGLPVLGSGWVAAVHSQHGNDLFVDGFGLAVALGSIGNCELVADSLEGFELPDEVVVDARITVRDDDTGTTMDAEEVLVKGVSEWVSWSSTAHREC